MEYLEGATLKDRLAAGPLGLDTVLRRRDPDRRRAGRRPYRGYHPPRHQTREHFHQLARSRQAPRLRPREDAARNHARGGLHDNGRDDSGRRDGNSRLHGSGAGARRGGRSPRRPLERRPGAVRNGQGDAARAGRPAAGRGVARAGTHHLEMPGDRSRSSLSARGRPADRSRAPRDADRTRR